MNCITIAQININSLRNKFSFLCEAVSVNIDILLVTETKLDSSFPSAQFHMHGYTTRYRLDRSANGGGFLLYVREDIPYKKIDNVDFDTGLEAMLIKINIRKTKWLISCSYNPHKADIKKCRRTVKLANIFRIITTVFILTMSLFCKIIKQN